MLGLTYAPPTATVLADLIDAGGPLPGFDLLSPSRF
jgi:glycine/D-amino acid oxidase-like deaminating enzyme